LYRNLIIGVPINLLGANFRCFYTLDVVPSIGFEVSILDKSIFYSGRGFYQNKK